MDLIIQDSTRVECIFFLMDENNVKKQIAIPWLSFGSDEGSYEPASVFLKSNPHPRAYGNFSRVLGKYVREEKSLSLAQAIHKMTLLAAQHMGFKKTGMIAIGYTADIVLFNPSTAKDNATVAEPHKISEGIEEVWVNGKIVFEK